MKLHIPTPCNENWNAMTPDAQGRFCGACQHSVVDFSEKSPTEIAEVLKNANGRVCGRVQSNKLSNLVSPSPSAKLRETNYWSKWKSIAASVLAFLGLGALSTDQMIAQSTNEPAPTPSIQSDQHNQINKDRVHINGTFRDSETGEVLPLVNIQVYCEQKLIIETHSDLEGKFSIEFPSSMLSTPDYSLKIQYVGYEGLTAIMNANEKNSLMDLSLTASSHFIKGEIMMGILVIQESGGNSKKHGNPRTKDQKMKIDGINFTVKQ